jgi:hypothetical protein
MLYDKHSVACTKGKSTEGLTLCTITPSLMADDKQWLWILHACKVMGNHSHERSFKVLNQFLGITLEILGYHKWFTIVSNPTTGTQRLTEIEGFYSIFLFELNVCFHGFW